MDAILTPSVLIPLTVLIMGWLLDLCLGDPSCLPHPVVLMGRWIALGEHRLNKGRHRQLKGALFCLLSLCAVAALAWGILRLLQAIPIAHAALSVLALFFCLAGHTLRREVRMVFVALEQSLDQGRQQVARIVGRDTAQLTAQEVRTAALETLAENLSDGVIAPLFWFALFGVPGALTYKMINTFDSMVGYQNERYKRFGCWAAHIDDVANYLPSRLTALLLVLCGIGRGRSLSQRLRFTLHYGPQHASPNSGWPEAALASILDCRFGGPHNYFGQEFYKPYIGSNPRPLTLHDMHTSLRLCFIAEVLAVALAGLVTIALS